MSCNETPPPLEINTNAIGLLCAEEKNAELNLLLRTGKRSKQNYKFYFIVLINLLKNIFCFGLVGTDNFQLKLMQWSFFDHSAFGVFYRVLNNKC